MKLVLQLRHTLVQYAGGEAKDHSVLSAKYVPMNIALVDVVAAP